jgi:hypothetical protein
VLSEARRLADSKGVPYVGTEHLLLGILRVPGGIATAALLSFGDLDSLAARVEDLLDPPALIGFEQHPRPWRARPIVDASGAYRYDSEGQLLQLFEDADGNFVRNGDGQLVRFRSMSNAALGFEPIVLSPGDSTEDGQRLGTEPS